MGENANLKVLLLNKAREAGFEVIHFTNPIAIPAAGPRLKTFLADGRHGDMDWMERNSERRSDPKALWPEVRSIVMLGMNYGPDRDPLVSLGERNRGVISVYAQGKDYHEVIKKRLKHIAGWLHQKSGADVKVFVDTAPIMEKPLAEASGIGWQGKHTNLVSREYGSWLFLGSILTTLQMDADVGEVDHCGSCRKCLDVCPTDAFPAPYQLDARRCISYLTIEHKGQIPLEFREPMGNRIFGCDDCLAVCPWNKYAREANEVRFRARPEADNPELSDLLDLDEISFRDRFKGSPIKRTGRDRFVRNVLIAAGNSGNSDLICKAEALLEDRSPLVRAMAVWCCLKLCSSDYFSRLKSRYRPTENVEVVIDEWERERG